MTSSRCAMTFSRRVGCVLIGLWLMACGGSDPARTPATPDPQPLTLELPVRFTDLPVPQDNPMTVTGVALGRRLFFDPILSVDSTVACGSCHLPAFAFSDTARFSRGVAGETGRQSMSLANLAWASELFWDGRAESLEAQVLMPVADPVEMGETWDNVERKLSSHGDYPALFEAAFPGEPITRHHVARAIAQYERTLISGESRFDRFLRGDVEFTEQELLGWTVYGTERGDCFHCHGTVLLTDNRFHNNGLDDVPVDIGHAEVSGNPNDTGHFRTPTLRNVEVTPPYMHDGRFASLEQVLDHYDGGMHRSERLDPLLLAIPETRVLTVDERLALLAFLKTLTDPVFLEEHVQ